MPAEKKHIVVKVCPFCRKRPFVINNMGVPSTIYCTNLDCAMYCVYTSIEKWNRRADTKVKKLTAHNPSSLTCLCKEGDLHYRRIVNGIVIEASLSVEVNKDCPIHGHYIGLKMQS